MIVVIMGDEDRIKGGKRIERDTGLLKARKNEGDGARIHGIGENVDGTQPKENGCMVDERNAV